MGGHHHILTAEGHLLLKEPVAVFLRIDEIDDRVLSIANLTEENYPLEKNRFDWGRLRLVFRAVTGSVYLRACGGRQSSSLLSS
jgi:hypothetical protein